MSGKKAEDRYKTRGKNSSTRGYASQRTDKSQKGYNTHNSSKQHTPDSRQREYDDRSSTRRKGRLGCFVSIGLLIVVLVGLYIIIFKSPLFEKKQEQIKISEPSPSATQYLESTPTPTPRLSTAVPSASPAPVSAIGYIDTEDEDGIVRMREEPNRTSDVLGELHNREVLYILQKEGDYYKIRYLGEMAYVHQDYVAEQLPEDNRLCSVVTYEIGYSKLVDITMIAPNLIIDMPYATSSNHVNMQMYPFELALLQESTAYKLKKAQEMFLEDGYSLVIWDAYRPYSVTVKTFEIIADPWLAANPEVGSKHNRGAAIDVTLYDLNNEEYVDMPTEVREMDRDLASRSSSYMSYQQRKNMEYMEYILGQAGFEPYAGEWWHYNDMEVAKYPVLDIQFEAWVDK